MTTAREIMHPDAECIQQQETLATAARKMRELGVGALPICGEDDRLRGIITDRDIVIKAVAEGKDPGSTRAADLAQGTPYYVDADAEVEQVTRHMMEHRVRRVPVIAGHRLVGMISEADLARGLPEEALGRFVSAVTQGPPDTVT